MPRNRSLLAPLALTLALLAGPALADISRGCSGRFVVSLPWGKNVILAELSGRSSCKKSNPNKCRLKAYEAMGKCAEAIWNDRWSHQIPMHCRAWPSGGRTQGGLRWTQVLMGLPNGGNSLKDRIEHNTCCRSGSYGKSYEVDLYYQTGGDKGCKGYIPRFGRFNFKSGIYPVSLDYGVNCKQLIDAGLCGPNFQPSKPSQGNTSKPGN